MDWIEMLISVPTEQAETAAAIANMVVPYGIYVEDYSDLEEEAVEIAHIDLIDEELLEKDKSKVTIHIYLSTEENYVEALSFLEERLAAAKIPFDIDKSGVNNSDWSDNWKKFFKVTEIGEKLVIRPSWEEYENTNNRKVLSIDPGAAFGTGTHATTRMCLELVEKYVKNGSTMLDIGCGSGILSIAGALLGANKVVGVDIDETAIKVSKENAAINDVSQSTEFIVGNLGDKVNGKFNIVCANIVADVIISLSKDVDKFMSEDAVFLCSGIIDMREDEVRQALIDNGFTIIDAIKTDNWRAFAAKR